MPTPGGSDFVQGYNAQVAVDSAHQVIVACEITSQPSDKGQLGPMMGQVRANTGQLPNEVSADAGYFSAKAVKGVTALGVEAFIPPDKVRHTDPLVPAPRGRIPRDLPLIERMRRRLRTRWGRKRYALRMETVEPVLGQVKQARGFRQFLLRGLEKVRGEWRLICTGHNLLKLFKVWHLASVG